MALCCSDAHLAVAASTKVFIVDQKVDGIGAPSASRTTPIILSAVINDSSTSIKSQADDDSNDGQSSEIGGKQSDSQTQSATLFQILAAGFSPSGRLLAVCNNRKQLVAWKLIDGDWEQLKFWALEKQATALTFSGSDDEKSVLVADRSGQVTEYGLEDGASSGKVLLGHLSILLDLRFSKSRRFLLTADRDEKIRVSHYPRTYDIQSFCLGHSEYVRTLCLCPGLQEADEREGILASGGGDDRVKLWRFLDGLQLASFDIGGTVDGSEASNGQQLERRRIRKLLSLRSSEPKTFRLVVLFEEASWLRFLNVSCSTTGEYSIADSVDWTADNSDCSKIVDIANIGSRVVVLVTGDSDLTILEIDASEATPLPLPPSSSLNKLIGCKELKECVANSKEELPPMEKVVQFDNVGEYLERKKARIESRTRDGSV